MSVRWNQIDIESQNLEEDTWRLIECGAHGATEASPSLVRCFLPTTELSAFKERIQHAGFIIHAESEVEDRAWVQEWPEIWKEVAVGALTIVPVRDATSRVQDPGKIFIVPGSGFGTGHHTSTQLALELLQHQDLKTLPTKTTDIRALDLGTGSGVLALAMERLLAVPIDAIDNDPDAIENAVTNIRLNESTLINLKTGELEGQEAAYTLITANLYAELLAKLEHQIANVIRHGGFLVLAGIMEEKEDLVAAAFAPQRWQVIRRRNEPGWIGFLLQRR